MQAAQKLLSRAPGHSSCAWKDVRCARSHVRSATGHVSRAYVGSAKEGRRSAHASERHERNEEPAAPADDVTRRKTATPADQAQ